MGESSRMKGLKAEPRFDLDLKYGVKGEIHVERLLKSIVDGNGQVEVKTKRVMDEWFYVETHCDKGRRGYYRPSGISVTTADTWFVKIGDSGMTVSAPTDLIRQMLDYPSTKDKEENHGDCPTKGKLINLAVLLFRYQRRLQAATAPPKPANEDPAPVTAADINWGYSS